MSLRAPLARPLPLACVAGAVLAAAMSLPALWWAPLNIDEDVTLRIAPHSFAAIVDAVFGERGGGPAHFLLTHATLEWPGGLLGLRLPSLLALVAALPAAAILGVELVGRTEAAIAVVALGAAPLAVAYATFGRPHTLFLAAVLWATVAALRAARLGGARRWILAGVLLGVLPYVHPTAPLYAATAFAGALVWARGPVRAVARGAASGAVAAVVVALPYFLHALDVLGERYGLAAGNEPRTYTGRSVMAEAVAAVAPAPYLVNTFTVLAAVGLIAIARSRPRAAIVLAVVIVAPVLFFGTVSGTANSAIFFRRYMLPALPAFLLTVAAGIVVLRRVAGTAVAAVAVAAVLALELRADVVRLARLHELRLGAVTEAVASSPNAVVVGASGVVGPRAHVGQLTVARPPALLPRYLELRGAATETSCMPAGERRRGIWLVYTGPEGTADSAADAIRRIRDVEVEAVAGRYVLVRTRRPVELHDLVALGARVSREWPDAAGDGSTTVCSANTAS